MGRLVLLVGALAVGAGCSSQSPGPPVTPATEYVDGGNFFVAGATTYTDPACAELEDCCPSLPPDAIVGCEEDAINGDGFEGPTCADDLAFYGCPVVYDAGTPGASASSGPGSNKAGGGGAPAACGRSWPSAACADCVSGSCCAVVLSCSGDPACASVLECVGTCTGSSGPSCQSDCTAQASAAAVGAFDAYLRCTQGTCRDACD
jgi:hypothetical protein